MKLKDSIKFGELRVEREGIAMGKVPQGHIEQEGTQFCVKNHNPVDKNFGCWPSMEDAQEHVDALEGVGDGEPVAGAYGHLHMDTNQWFHPPSLAQRSKPSDLVIPTDDPMETNNKFMDVTKRNEAYEERMKLLKRSAPTGPIPVRTTQIPHHTSTGTPPLFGGRVKSKAVRKRGKGMFVAYNRRGVL